MYPPNGHYQNVCSQNNVIKVRLLLGCVAMHNVCLHNDVSAGQGPEGVHDQTISLHGSGMALCMLYIRY